MSGQPNTFRAITLLTTGLWLVACASNETPTSPSDGSAPEAVSASATTFGPFPDGTTIFVDVDGADPKFVDATARNYRLRKSSSLVDAGTNTDAPLTDVLGHTRPLDGNGDGVAVTDMGAYERPAAP